MAILKDNWNDLCEKLDNDIWGEAYNITELLPTKEDNIELDIRVGAAQGPVLGLLP